MTECSDTTLSHCSLLLTSKKVQSCVVHEKAPTCSWCRAAGAGWCVWWRDQQQWAGALRGQSGRKWSQSHDHMGGPSKYLGRWTESRMASAGSRCPRLPRLHLRPMKSRTFAAQTPSAHKCCWRRRARSRASGTTPPRWRAPHQPRSQPARQQHTRVS